MHTGDGGEIIMIVKGDGVWNDLVPDLRLEKSKNIAQTIASYYDLHVLNDQMELCFSENQKEYDVFPQKRSRKMMP